MTTGDHIPATDRYVDWRELASGGTATVYRVTDTRLKRDVAVKLLNLGAMRSEKLRRRMIDGLSTDVNAARELYSPSICPTYDIFEENGRIGLVMELIEGIELSKWLRERRDRRYHTSDERLLLLRAITEALALAHTRIVHRDLKPANIMLRNGDITRPVIMDLGFAVLGTRADPGDPGGLTPDYAAPEQLENPEAVDQRADLWALGVMAYEFFAGGIPDCALSNTSAADFQARKAVRVPWERMAPPSARNPRVPPALDNLIGRLLTYDVEERVRTAREVLDALDHITLNPLGTGGSSGNGERRDRAIPIPGGNYIFGSARGGRSRTNERPHRHVTLSPFVIDRHPVTVAEYRAFAEINGRPVPEPNGTTRASREDHPVVGVTRDEATAFARWVGGRLPTEAQWECAARGGIELAAFPWGDTPEPDALRANIGGVRNDTSPIGSHPGGASGYGVEDMCGNVREWCLDPYDESLFDNLAHDTLDPIGRGKGDSFTVRGGGFESLRSSGRCAFRDGLPGDERRRDVGFRVSYDPVPSRSSTSEHSRRHVVTVTEAPDRDPTTIPLPDTTPETRSDQTVVNAPLDRGFGPNDPTEVM